MGARRDVTIYQLKAEHKSVSNVDFGYRLKEGVVIPHNAILIDNVCDTGTTYRAASKASGIKKIMVIAASPSVNFRCGDNLSSKILL